MDKLASIEKYLSEHSGNFILSSSIRPAKRVIPFEPHMEHYTAKSYVAVLSMDNSPVGLGIVASGNGNTVDEAVEEMLKEADEIYGN